MNNDSSPVRKKKQKYLSIDTIHHAGSKLYLSLDICNNIQLLQHTCIYIHNDPAYWIAALRHTKHKTGWGGGGERIVQLRKLKVVDSSVPL